MKAYRLVTLMGAVLITALLARVLTQEAVGETQHHGQIEWVALK